MSIRIATVLRRLAVLALLGGAVGLSNLNAQDVTVAQGVVFSIDSAWVGLPAFAAKPKLSCLYNNVVSGKPQKASTKLLGYTAGAPLATFLWTKKMKLYDKANFIAMQKNGVDIAGWLGSGFQRDQYMNGYLGSAELDPPAYVGRNIVLVPPQVDRVLESFPVGGQYTLQGRWFGTKKPKVWIEYVSNNALGSVKRLKCKVLPPTAYADVNGKLSYMGIDGSSELVLVLYPGFPSDLATFNGNIVIENGVGMHYGTYTP